jgi:hypothetical protein
MQTVLGAIPPSMTKRAANQVIQHLFKSERMGQLCVVRRERVKSDYCRPSALPTRWHLPPPLTKLSPQSLITENNAIICILFESETLSNGMTSLAVKALLGRKPKISTTTCWTAAGVVGIASRPRATRCVPMMGPQFRWEALSGRPAQMVRHPSPPVLPVTTSAYERLAA